MNNLPINRVLNSAVKLREDERKRPVAFPQMSIRVFVGFWHLDIVAVKPGEKREFVLHWSQRLGCKIRPGKQT